MNSSAETPAGERAYTFMAEHYDHILRQVDWERWYKYLRSIMIRYVPHPESILEIGTGTGKFGARFSSDEFVIYGMDISPAMLAVAKKRARGNYRIFCADVRKFSLRKPVDFIFAVHDTMNYLLTKRDFVKALKNIAACMHPKSCFMFDVTTEHNVRTNFHGRENVTRSGRNTIVWANRYDARRKVIVSDMTFRAPGKRARRETHEQRIYSRAEVESMIREAGLTLVTVYHDYQFSPPAEDAVMINFITRLSRR